MSAIRASRTLAIGILDAARQRHHAAVAQDISIEWVDGGIVDVRNEHAFVQIVAIRVEQINFADRIRSAAFVPFKRR